LGKLLRIHVTATGSYTVPNDNPFVNNAAYRPEIWATGLRNPWRFAFDPVTEDLYIADVGQGAWEEINVQPASSNGGENYGWPIMEGKGCYNAATCDTAGLTLPVAVYDHRDGDCSVTGGPILTGHAPGQAPVYLSGDWCSGRIRGLQRDGADWADMVLLDTELSITSFGVDEAGHVYVADDGGAVYRLFEPLLYLPSLAAD
jgi:glucose/arabinose dehydrogenase